MPPPDNNSCSSGTAGLSADEIDRDYLYFLRHVRPEGRGHVLEIPPKDGSSRSHVIRYDEPLAAPNAEPPAASCGGGIRSAASSEEDYSSAEDEVSSGAASPPAGAAGEAQGCTVPVPVERDGLLSPKVEPALYNSDMDEDYRFFLQQSRLRTDSQWVLETGKVKEEEGSDKNEGMDNAGLDLQLVNDDSPMEFKMKMEVDEEAEEEKPSNVILARSPESDPSNSEASSRQGHSASVKEEEDSDKNEGMDTAGSDIQLVNVLEVETEMEVDEEEEEEEPFTVPVTRTPELESSNGEASSRQGHCAMLCNASELEGVIWPSHIVERPESDFKQKLMKDLNRPFNREEYDELFAKAIGRTPVMKERRTRRRVTDYPWKHEMAKSYFDCYPDLADQVEGESSYPNRLALLRGFFFWLQNIGHDEQFRPWRDDYKNYRVSVGLQRRSRRRAT